MAPRKAVVIASVIAIGALVAGVFFVSYHFARKGSVSKVQDGPVQSTSSNPSGGATLPSAGNDPSGGATLPSAGNDPSGGATLPSAGNDPSGGATLPSAGNAYLDGTAPCSPMLSQKRTSLTNSSAMMALMAARPPPAQKAPGFLTSCGNNPYVVLTFDDGPFVATNNHNGSPATEFVLDELKAAGVKATFFISPGGQDGHYGPAECQVLKRAVAEGHEVQWHTWTHADLTLPTTNLQAEVQRCRDWIRNECVFQASPASFTMLRPPFGYTNDKVNGDLNGLGMTSITWNIDTDDWRGNNMDQIKASISAGSSEPSAVILMHDRWYQPGLITWIKQHFASRQFVTASQCYRDCGSTRC